MDTQNSFSGIIKQFTQMNANALETFERINEAITSEKDSITVSVDLFGTPDDDGVTTIKTYQIPSFGFIDREIKRLENNIKALSGVGTADATVQMPDGSFKKIISRKLKTAANDLTSIALPTEFETTDNDFFEDYLNPLLTVKFDVSNQIVADTERVLVKRYIFQTNDEFAAAYFDDNYKNVDEINYQTFVEDLISSGANATVDEQVRDLPFKSTQFYGGFDVLAVEDAEREFIVDGEPVIRTVKLYTLNKLTYTDGDKSLKDTEFISIGDELLVNSGNNNTRYRVQNVYNGTTQVELRLTEGFDSIKIGSDQLRIYKALENSVSLGIHVGFDERQVVFFKAIDPDSKIIAENWSPGVGFYSNDLTIESQTGGTQTLSAFYRDSVSDFGQFIKALKEDFIPPATVGLQPDPVLLDATNFQVVQINTHLTENDAFDSIKKLNNDKITISESIKKLDDTIVSKRSEIATKKYKSEIEKSKDKNNLNTLIEKRSGEAKLYSSVVNQIQSINSDQNVTDIKPKFRVRGFWKVPEAKTNADTLPQEIVKFKIQYRYVSASGKTSNIEQIPFTQDNKTTTASFSNWNQYETPTRKRQRDVITSKYVWITESVEDGQEVNFNQLDLPINFGENVEIRIKAVSEAGYPSNPVVSEWSETILVQFPEGLLDTTDIINLIDENGKETIYVKLVDELDSKGVYTHIADSFIANEKYFTHGATNIASGFLSSEQTPISLFDKLIDLQKEIESLKEQLENAEGELKVTIVDEEGNTTAIDANTTTRLFAGYYVDEVADLNIKKGHVVTKTFKLLLENSKATDLELIARMIGKRDEPVHHSSTTGNEVTFEMGTHDFTPDSTTGVANPIVLTDRIQNDTYYTVEGKYDLVPIQYQNISSDELAEYHNEDAPHQSAQQKGQFIYSRFMDVAGENAMYATAPLEFLDGTNTATDSETRRFEYYGVNGVGDAGDVTSDFIWDGNFDGSNNPTAVILNSNLTSGDYDDSIYLHVDHPRIPAAVSNTATSTFFQAGYASMAQFSTLKAGQDTYANLQTAYRRGTNTAYNYNRSVKMSFEDNDQFLLGGRSCGAYLFLSPTRIGNLSVDGDNKFGKRIIGKSDTKQVNSLSSKSPSISIDVVFQYRMTDYFGVTATGVDTSDGLLGGLNTNKITNLTYSKKIGIDLFDSFDNQLSFDLEVFAKYKPKGFNLNNTKTVRLQKPVA
mgnify:CR=1 FL=1|tara:strand:+ start:19141 stop:22752 length:3612 start_codon:yes stop_codon:yes gene_type:complete